MERIGQTIIRKYLLQSLISIPVSDYKLIEANVGDSNRNIFLKTFFFPTIAICLEKGCKLPEKQICFDIKRSTVSSKVARLLERTSLKVAQDWLCFTVHAKFQRVRTSISFQGREDC